MEQLDKLKKDVEPLLAQANGIADEATREQILRSGESVYAMTKVFENTKSSPIERAVAVLNCMGNLSQVAVTVGGGPVAVAAVACLSMIVKILEFFGAQEPEPTLKEQFEEVIRKVYGEVILAKLDAVMYTVDGNILKFKDIYPNSLTTEQIESRAGFAAGAARFTLFEAAGWLKQKSNYDVEGWEEVFVMYARSVIKDISLELVAVDRAQTKRNEENGDVPKFAFQRGLGLFATQLNETLTSVHDRLLECGNYYAAGGGRRGAAPYSYGYQLARVTKFIEWEDGFSDRWEDINIGDVGHYYWQAGRVVQTERGSILAVHPRTGRLWGNRFLADSGLFTGFPGDTQDVWNHYCTDIGIFAGANEDDNDRLLLTTPDGKLHVTEWNESTKGFVGEFWSPHLGGPGTVIMARGFRALKPGGSTYEDYVYILRSEDAADKSAEASPVELQVMTWNQLVESKTASIQPMTVWREDVGVPYWKDWGGYQHSEPSCRVSVSDRYVFLNWYENKKGDFTGLYQAPRAVRTMHNDLLPAPHKPYWEDIILPASQNGLRVRSVQLEAYSDDAVVGMLGLGLEPGKDGQPSSKAVVGSGYFNGSKWEWKTIGGDCSAVVRHAPDSWRLFAELKRTASHFAPWITIAAEN